MFPLGHLPGEDDRLFGGFVDNQGVIERSTMFVLHAVVMGWRLVSVALHWYWQMLVREVVEQYICVACCLELLISVPCPEVAELLGGGIW